MPAGSYSPLLSDRPAKEEYYICPICETVLWASDKPVSRCPKHRNHPMIPLVQAVQKDPGLRSRVDPRFLDVRPVFRR